MGDPIDPTKKNSFTKLNYLLDLDHLRDLEAIAPLGEIEKFMSEISVIFLKGAAQRIQDLDGALKREDFDAIVQHSFQLRGLCSSIGAKYMVDLCQQIEETVSSRNIRLAKTIGEQLKDSFLVTRDQVQAYQGQLSKKA